jgi:hypothetical protein
MLDFEPGVLRSAMIKGAAETANASRRSKVPLVRVSDQCRGFESRGVRTSGPTDRAITDGGYDGATEDDASLGIPSEIMEFVIPDKGI